MGRPHAEEAKQQPHRLHVLWWSLCLVPVLAAFVLHWLPAINGPHLWFGLPSVLLWTCLPGSALVSVVLLVIERTRTDRTAQDALDEQAAETAAVSLDERESL